MSTIDLDLTNPVNVVKVMVGDEYQHPDDFDHYIQYVQLWNGETFLAQATFTAGAMGSAPANLEVDFFVVPSKNMKLMVHCMLQFCQK